MAKATPHIEANPDMAAIKTGVPKDLRPHGTAAKRTPLQREADFVFIADRLIRGLSQEKICQELAAARPYSIKRPSVCQDIKIIMARWKEAAHMKVDEAKARHLAKLNAMEERCHKAIDALENREVRTGSVTEFEGKKIKRGTTRKGPDNTLGHWLKMLQWVWQEQAKIFGMYAPVKVEAGSDGFMSLSGGNGDVTLNITVNTDKSVQELTNFPTIEAEAEVMTSGAN